jgi:hypothetical protein
MTGLHSETVSKTRNSMIKCLGKILPTSSVSVLPAFIPPQEAAIITFLYGFLHYFYIIFFCTLIFFYT